MKKKALWLVAGIVMSITAIMITGPNTAVAAMSPSDTTTVFLDFQNITGLQNHALYLRFLDRSSGMETVRTVVDSVAAGDSDTPVHGVGVGKTYVLQFFSDQNDNGKYDGNTTDRAWQIAVGPVTKSMEFIIPDNLAETPITWTDAVTVHVAGLDQVTGKRLEARLVDMTTGKEVSRMAVNSVSAADSTFTLPGLMTGQSYWLEAWSDTNGNGRYDGLSADRSWRIPVSVVDGNVIVHLQPVTALTQLQWPNLLTLELRGMTLHIGQMMQFRLVRVDSLSDSPAGKELARAVIDTVRADTLFVQLPGLVSGQKYDVDFFADANKNGRYDAPPIDHAWRISFTDTAGDTTLVFTHNTDFTDIQWPYLVTLDLRNMTELGNHMNFRMVQANTDSEVYRTQIDSVRTANFAVLLPGARSGQPYRIDFFADVNNNGQYDKPPTDHAWLFTLDSTATDTTLVFTHSTSYTDIAWPGPVGVKENAGVPTAFALYQNAPNPFNPSTVITFELSLNSAARLEVFNIAGQKVRTLVDGKLIPGKYSYTWDGRDSRGTPLSSGVYFYRLKTDTMNKSMRMLLLK